MTVCAGSAEGVRLAVTEHGEGTPELVLVHGFANSSNDWADVAAELSTDRRVLGYDHRGHGDSTHTGDPASYTVAELADDLAAVVRGCTVEPVDVLGHSMGGMVAARFAADHPELVRSVILVNTTIDGTGAIPLVLLARLLRTARRDGMGALAGLLDRIGAGSAERTDAQRARARADVSRMDVAAFAALGAEIGRPGSLPESLAAIRVPVSVLVGERDRFAALARDPVLARLRLGRADVIAGAGHAPHTERPRSWCVAVRAHLAWAGECYRHNGGGKQCPGC